MPDTRADIPPQPTRLSDYRPPDFFVETVDLDFDLDPAETRVISNLRLRRNPEAPPTAALRLDGDELDLVALMLDGRPLAAGRLSHRARRRAGHSSGARQLRARDPDADRPGAQYGAVGSVHVRRQFLYAMRARGVSPDHLFPRSSRRDGALHRDDPRRQDPLPGAAVERQPVGFRRSRRMAGIGRTGSIRTRSPPTCSRSSPAT